jgi:MinD superfamily P-loop ATPase
MTKHGETDGFTASKFVGEIERYLGGAVNYIICNRNNLDEQSIARYAEEQQYPVIVDIDDERLIHRQLMYRRGDLIRHDRDMLAEVLMDLL